MRRIRRFFSDKAGSTVIEYGLIAALMSVAIISGVGAFGNSLSGAFNALSNTINDQQSPPAH
jgi:pilus assembly protein Flp/PilA